MTNYDDRLLIIFGNLLDLDLRIHAHVHIWIRMCMLYRLLKGNNRRFIRYVSFKVDFVAVNLKEQ